MEERKFWSDGEKLTTAYFVGSVGRDEDDEEDAAFARSLYNAFCYNQLTASEIIAKIEDLVGFLEPDYLEVISRDCRQLGVSEDGKHLVTYDAYTGALDVWQITNNQ